MSATDPILEKERADLPSLPSNWNFKADLITSSRKGRSSCPASILRHAKTASSGEEAL